MRAVASRAEVSPGYVTAIELGNNPTTGKPALPSVTVISGLARALDMDFEQLLTAIRTASGEAGHRSEAHILLYWLARDDANLLDTVERLFGGLVDHWLYIADPREAAARGPDIADPARVSIRRWPLGSFPYADRYLRPNDLIEALEAEVMGMADGHSGERVGVAIADCSSVMRWLLNADALIDLEPTWEREADRIFQQHLGAPPAANVCVYQHADFEAIGHSIDPVGTVLNLVRGHDRVVVLDDRGDAVTGSPAIRRILENVRPAGVSSAAWSDLIEAAAVGLAKAS